MASAFRISHVCAFFNSLLPLFLLKLGKCVFTALLFTLAEACDVFSAGDRAWGRDMAKDQ